MNSRDKVWTLLTVLALISLAVTAGPAAGNTDPVISVAGDLLGHLIGTVSRADGTVAVKDAAVEVTGQTPAGPWKSSAKTDEQGFFKADLPLASVGPVKISARAGEMIAEGTLDSGDIAKRLTPRPAKGSANRLSLDGQWSFVPDPPRDFIAQAQSLPVARHQRARPLGNGRLRLRKRVWTLSEDIHRPQRLGRQADQVPGRSDLQPLRGLRQWRARGKPRRRGHAF